MLKKERFNAKYNTAMGQIPRSKERISSLECFLFGLFIDFM